MVRLSTQPDVAKALPLRSGFYALPLNSGQLHLFARLHHQGAHDDDDEGDHAEGSEGTKQLFVTGLPLGASTKGLKAALGKVWGDEVKVTKVELLPAPAATDGVYSLYQQQLALATAAGDGNPDVAPLFDLSGASTSTSVPPPHSALVTFSSTPTLPPPPFPATTPLNLPPAPSFLASSAARHALARPHRSIATAHVDEWMRAFDARKLAAAPAAYSAPETPAQAKKAKKKGKKGGKTADVGPLPGSAAEALARHTAQQAKLRDRSFNPDEVDEGEWTTVARGGRHGKSLLPTGAVPSLTGYGGVNVKVAGKKRGRASEEEEKNDAGIRKIVGEGFYRFNQADSRKKHLASLKAKFEEDKVRLDRMRKGGAGRPRGGGFGGKERRAFKPY
ncbi:hypothetical protein JCM8097_006715 [Rhodosporidiobolus ruineniae]